MLAIYILNFLRDGNICLVIEDGAVNETPLLEIT